MRVEGVKKTRKHLTGTEKVAVLRRHLIDKQAVSDLCDEAGIQPSQLYRWLKQFFENGAQALERRGGQDAAVRSTTHGGWKSSRPSSAKRTR